MIIAPTVDKLFKTEKEDSRIIVLKSGIYHIHGTATASHTHWTGYVKINGNAISHHVNAISSGRFVQFAFDVTRRLNVDDYVEIYTNVASYNTATYNTLTIQRISD